MQFNEHATNDDIVSDVKWWLTGSYAGTIDFHINDITRSANRELDDVVSLILRSDSRWQFDDSNFTTLPIGTADLMPDQQDYELSGAEFLSVSEVSVLNVDGDWVVLKPLDRNKGKAQRLIDLEATSGMPEFYDKIGNSIMLYPLPSASDVVTGTDTGGIRVVVERPGSYFIPTDTTKAPGFAPTFHRIISLGIAMDYCVVHGLHNKLVTLENKKNQMKMEMVEHYTRRSKDEQPRLGLKEEDYGASSLI